MNQQLHLPKRVHINDVVVRDGFQNEPDFVPTDIKIALIDRLSRSGLAKIEIASFVSPKAVPQMRDAEEICRRVARVPGVSHVVLVPNMSGCERALSCGVEEINLFMSISETHNLANIRMSTEQSLRQLGVIMGVVSKTPTRVNGTLSTAFGCPFEGAQDQTRVLDAVQSFLDLGMHSITLADTTGMADPMQVSRMTAAYFARFPDVPLTMHFHNTRGMGLANVLASAAGGVTSFDGSLGGLGGCPFAPGATGNICTEDTVNMFEASGVDTGVDLDLLLALARELPAIVGHGVPGQLVSAGRISDLHPKPESVAALLAPCAIPRP